MEIKNLKNVKLIFKIAESYLKYTNVKAYVHYFLLFHQMIALQKL